MLNGATLAETTHAVADGYPVSLGHALVVPRRHVESLFDLSTDEYQSCFELARHVGLMLMARYQADGIKIGVNCGRAAGQTVMHARVHVI